MSGRVNDTYPLYEDAEETGSPCKVNTVGRPYSIR